MKKKLKLDGTPKNSVGKRKNAGTKPVYTEKFVSFNDRVPSSEVAKIREFIRDLKKKYLKGENK